MHFYGTTQQLCFSTGGGPIEGCGTVFKFDPATGEVGGIYFFPDGFMSPMSPLLLGSDGALYGTAASGGAHAAGAVFRLDISTEPATASVRHAFDPATSGREPRAGLIEIGGFLYGTAELGGPGGAGTIVKVPLSGSTTAQVLHAFGPIKPNQVTAELTLSNGVFYGASQRGGLHDGGTVFTFDPAGSSLGVVHDFKGIDEGGYPYSGVIVGTDGALYGVTPNGGIQGVGVVYKVDSNGANFQILHQFDTANYSTNGYAPYGRLVDIGGMLYGTTSSGGADGVGTVFTISESGAGFQVLHALDDSSLHEGSSAAGRVDPRRRRPALWHGERWRNVGRRDDLPAEHLGRTIRGSA